MDILSTLLVFIFILDRGLKLGAVLHFFRRPRPQALAAWPTISLIQPITQGAANLEANLESRLTLDYPASLQHIWVCDVADERMQRRCRKVQQRYPSANIEIVLANPDGVNLASKVAKLHAGLLSATAKVLCFIDDDIALKPDALRQMMPYLEQTEVGAAFGLACAVSWGSYWSSLMSVFVNSQALLSYIPLIYLTDPFTITGHFFAIARRDFDAAKGLVGVSRRIDDDHELARRLQAIGLKAVQTPVIYQVSNEFATFRAYADQLKRWFIFPRQAMAPFLSIYQKTVAGGLSVGLFLTPLLALIALSFPSVTTLLALGLALSVYSAGYIFCNRVYLGQPVALRQLLLVPWVALLTPLQVLWALLVPNTAIVWRGQRLKIERGGSFQILE